MPTKAARRRLEHMESARTDAQIWLATYGSGAPTGIAVTTIRKRCRETPGALQQVPFTPRAAGPGSTSLQTTFALHIATTVSPNRAVRAIPGFAAAASDACHCIQRRH